MVPTRIVCVPGVLRAAALVLAVLVPSAAAAQAVVDARRVEFAPSADHDREVDGVPYVTSYSMQVYAAGATTPLQTVDLGKPSAGADGLIRIDFVERLSSPLTPGQLYEARIAASGPGGTSASDLSDAFSFTPVCEPVLSSAGVSLGAGGASGTVSVTVGTGCAWTAASGAAWLAITLGATGNGPGQVAFSAAANSASTSRTATITIAGRPFQVSQAGVACSYGISPGAWTAPAGGGAVGVTVTAASGCSWSGASGAGWLTFVGASGGTGGGTVTVAAAPNTSAAPRSATITIAGRPFQVSQAGVPCSYSISPGAWTAPAGGEAVGVTVTAASGCSWSGTSGAAWLTFVGGSGGTGGGTVTVAAAPNTAPTPRTGTATIAGQTFTVVQAAAACTYSVTPTALSMTSAGGTATIAVTTDAGCTWTAAGATAWLAMPGGTRTGPGAVTLTLGTNQGEARSATLTVAGRAVVVSQTAAVPTPPSKVRVVVR